MHLGISAYSDTNVLSATKSSVFGSSENICIYSRKIIYIPSRCYSNLLLSQSFSWRLNAFLLISAEHSPLLPVLLSTHILVRYQIMWLRTHTKRRGGGTIKTKERNQPMNQTMRTIFEIWQKGYKIHLIQSTNAY